MLACCSITAFNVANFHGIRQHARQAERHALGVLLAVHGDLETVAEINVHNLARYAIKHEIRGMAIAQTENVAHHGHDGEGARVVCSTVEPGFGGFRLEPENAVEILACGIIQSVAKDFDFLHKREAVVIRCHLQHDAVLNVKENLAAVAVLSDEHV